LTNLSESNANIQTNSLVLWHYKNRSKNFETHFRDVFAYIYSAKQRFKQIQHTFVFSTCVSFIDSLLQTSFHSWM